VVPALAFSPDGERLVTGSYREAKVWRRSPAAGVAPAKPVAASKFKLVAAGADGVKLLEAASGAVLRELKHGAAVTAFALSPDDQRVASAGADHKIKLWEAATGKLLSEIVGDWDTEQALMKAVRGADRANLEVTWWTSEIQKAEKEVADLDARLKKAQELAGTAKTGLEAATKDKTAKQEADQKAAAALNEVMAQIKAAGAEAAAAGADEAAQTEPKAADAGAEKTEAKTEAKAELVVAELTKKQEALQAAATQAAEALKVAEEALQRAKAAVEDAAKEIAQVTQMKAAGAEQVVKAKAALETAKKAQAEATAAKEKAGQAIGAAATGLSELVFSPDGSQLAGLNAQGQLRAWAVASGRALPGPGSIQWGLTWTDERGPQVSSGVLMDPARSEWKLERTLGTGDGQSPITDRVNALSFSSDGKLLAIGSGEPSRSGDVSIWQMPTGMMTARFDEVHLDSVLALAFSPDGKQLATGAADKVMKALDVATGKVLKVFEGHTHHVLGVAWRADGRMLASAGADNVLKVWDAATGERRQNVAGWDKEVTAVTYLGGGDAMATASGDAKLRLISSAGAEVKQLAGAADFVHALSLSGEGRWLVAGGQDGVLRLWDVASGQVAQTFPVE
jgi:WD40 repeat protein